MNLAEFVILVITVLWISTVFFWAVVRPYILESAAWELSNLRSEIDWAIIETKEGAQTRPAQALSNMLNEPDLARVVLLGHLVFCDRLWRREMQIAASEHERMFENAPKWVIDAYKRCVQVRMKTILANSPSWWIPISLILLIAYFSNTVAKWWREICFAMLMKPHFPAQTRRHA